MFMVNISDLKENDATLTFLGAAMKQEIVSAHIHPTGKTFFTQATFSQTRLKPAHSSFFKETVSL